MQKRVGKKKKNLFSKFGIINIFIKIDRKTK